MNNQVIKVTKKSDNDEFVVPFQYARETKPMKAYDELFTALLPHGEKFILRQGESYIFGEENHRMGVLLQVDGVISGCQSPSDKALGSLYPPAIIGLIDAYAAFYDTPEKHQRSCYAETDTTLFFVSLEKFVHIMDTYNLWHDIARVLAHRLLIMASKLHTATTFDSYELIKTLILELWSYQDKHREDIKLPNFIQRRSGVSRSRIMKILADLKSGGYIEMKNGILVNVNKLPESY